MLNKKMLLSLEEPALSAVQTGGGSLTAFRTESRRKKKVIENFSSSYRILFLFGPELHLLTRKKNRHHGEDQEEGYVLNIVFD